MLLHHFADLERFGLAKRAWFERWLDLPGGIPSHDTFGRVFAAIDPDHFAACFAAWTRSIAAVTDGEVVALDGKTLRGSAAWGPAWGNADEDGRALQVVSAWATQNRLVERVTEAELDAHLRTEREAGRQNSRNGRTQRRLLSARGLLDVSMPRDRAATFEPELVPTYLRRLPDFDEKVLLLYSRGLSTRDIQGHLKELYQTEVSPELISDVTDALVPLVQAWQARPLAAC